jgi:hypothetical protein
LFSFSSCFLLVGIQSPRYAFGWFSLLFRLKIIPVSFVPAIKSLNKGKTGLCIPFSPKKTVLAFLSSGDN